MQIKQTENSIRLEFLDSLRGLASIAVVISHFVITYRLDLDFKALYFSPMHFFFDGFSAVTFFFILSGYVLTLSLKRNDDLNLKTFYIKRIFRIMPAYLVTLVISLLFKVLIIDRSHYIDINWATEFWNRPIGIKSFLTQVVFLETSSKTAELVPQNWSLRIEMIFSFLMPFLYFIYKKLGNLYFIIL